MAKNKIINNVPTDLKTDVKNVDGLVEEFVEKFAPLEKQNLYILIDARTKARYCECHIKADKIISLGTIDVPLDPDEQLDYRANRAIVENHAAYSKMKDDAELRRSFSDIVTEYNDTFDSEHPLKIIGGQHRFQAIKKAFRQNQINEYHGMKVYFDLDSEQRLDVQLISNTNIAVSSDLLDRMYETVSGPELREWCQRTKLLEKDQDFADKKQKGEQVTVRDARIFILNYYKGKDDSVSIKNFDKIETIPVMAKTGGAYDVWDKFKGANPTLWKNTKLIKAAKEFALLVKSQRKYFKGRQCRSDFADKAISYAVLSAWAYIAGMLEKNVTRLERHFELRKATGKDPLNSTILAKGRHKSDPENYRGLGCRTDAKERGRLAELFFLQAEKGEGIKANIRDLAISKFHAKQAMLEVQKMEARV